MTPSLYLRRLHRTPLPYLLSLHHRRPIAHILCHLPLLPLLPLLLPLLLLLPQIISRRRGPFHPLRRGLPLCRSSQVCEREGGEERERESLRRIASFLLRGPREREREERKEAEV